MALRPGRLRLQQDGPCDGANPRIGSLAWQSLGRRTVVEVSDGRGQQRPSSSMNLFQRSESVANSMPPTEAPARIPMRSAH